jgi:hypothetical protein
MPTIAIAQTSLYALVAGTTVAHATNVAGRCVAVRVNTVKIMGNIIALVVLKVTPMTGAEMTTMTLKVYTTTGIDLIHCLNLLTLRMKLLEGVILCPYTWV